MKKIILLVLLTSSVYSQIIFQDKFNTLTLSGYTTAYTTTQYTLPPNGYIQINEGYKNHKGSSIHPNTPFHTDSLKYKGWGIVYNDNLKDTFLVTTSWVDTNKIISRWILLPTINGISVNSVLHWRAMSPDPNYAEGYAVYISTNTSSNDTSIFNNSNKIFQISDNTISGGGEKSQWTTRSISLANYAGQSIRIAFKNISHQRYQLWIDDITVENLPYAYDATLYNIKNPKYVSINQPFTLSARIENKGYQNISNINLAYSVQGIAYNNQSFSFNTSLQPFNTTTVTFANSLSINIPGIYKVKIWINQVNGQSDQNTFNDTISYDLSVLSSPVYPKVLIEQITDASMTQAPANQDSITYICQQDTNIIAVQIHQQDSLKCNISSLHSQFFNIPEKKPVSLINRQYSFATNRNYYYLNEWRNQINTIKNKITPCKVSISNVIVDTDTRKIQWNVNVYFYQQTKGTYRINSYLVENHVYGNPTDTTINGYNQLSQFYFTPYSNYYQQGYYSSIANAFVLNAYQYQHQKVLHKSIDGIYGDASVIPQNTIAGNTYSKTYTLTIPTNTNNTFKYHFQNLYLVAYAYEHDTTLENREILDVCQYKVIPSTELVSIQDITPSNNKITIYPQPASKYLIIKGLTDKISIGKIYHITGQEALSISSEYIDISSLPAGVYILYIQTSRKLILRKILIE